MEGRHAYKIFGGTFIRVAGRLLQGAAAVFSTGILARHLGAAGYGDYVFIFTLVSFLSIFSEMGINTVVLRESVRDGEREGELIAGGLYVKIFFALVFYIASIVIVLLLPGRGYILLPYAAGSLLLFIMSGNLIDVVFQKRYSMSYIVLYESVGSALNLFFIALLAKLDASFIFFVLSPPVAAFVSVAAAYAFSRGFIKMRFKPDGAIIKGLLKAAAPVGIAGILAAVNYKADTIILWLFKGPGQTGIYGASMKIYELIKLVPALFVVNFLPLAAAAKNSAEFGRIFRKAAAAIIIFTLPAAAGLTIISDGLIRLIYGPGYESSALLLKYLVWMSVFSFFENLFFSAYIVRGLYKTALFVNAVSAALTITLNIALVRYFGMWGSATACIIVFFVLFLMYAASYRTRFGSLVIHRELLHSAAATAIMWAALYFFHLPNIYVEIAAGAGIYGALIFPLVWKLYVKK